MYSIAYTNLSSMAQVPDKNEDSRKAETHKDHIPFITIEKDYGSRLNYDLALIPIPFSLIT